MIFNFWLNFDIEPPSGLIKSRIFLYFHIFSHIFHIFSLFLIKKLIFKMFFQRPAPRAGAGRAGGAEKTFLKSIF